MNDHADPNSSASKLADAKAGAGQLLDMLDDQDSVSLLSFSDNFTWDGPKGQTLGTQRAALHHSLNGLIAGGNTLLFGSILEAVNYVNQNADKHRISAVVVLTDGEDNQSVAAGVDEASLLRRLNPSPEGQCVRSLHDRLRGGRGRVAGDS